MSSSILPHWDVCSLTRAACNLDLCRPGRIDCYFKAQICRNHTSAYNLKIERIVFHARSAVNKRPKF